MKQKNILYLAIFALLVNFGPLQGMTLQNKLTQTKQKLTGLKDNLAQLRSKLGDLKKKLGQETEESVKKEREKAAAQKAEAERIAAELAATEKATAEKLVADKLAAEKAEAEKAALEKAETERRAAEKLASEKAAAEKLAADKAAKKGADFIIIRHVGQSNPIILTWNYSSGETIIEETATIIPLLKNATEGSVNFRKIDLQKNKITNLNAKVPGLITAWTLNLNEQLIEAYKPENTGKTLMILLDAGYMLGISIMNKLKPGTKGDSYFVDTVK